MHTGSGTELPVLGTETLEKDGDPMGSPSPSEPCARHAVRNLGDPRKTA